MTSARSAGDISIESCCTAFGKKPPSAPIRQKGRTDAPGRRVGSETIFRITNLELQPLRKRKRYHLGSTCSTGQVRPLATMVLPKNSGFQIGGTSVASSAHLRELG